MSRSRDVTAGGSSALAMALLVLPWFAPGDLLVRDLVAVRTPALSADLLTSADVLPRDVPGEVVAATVAQLAGGRVAVVAVLLVAAGLLGIGVGRVLDSTRAATVTAAVVVVVNPWVWGRLQQGQWLVVVALAGVPWVALAVADDDRVALARALAGAALTGFVVVVVVWPTLVVVGLITRRWRTMGLGIVVTLVGAIPWLVLAREPVVDPDGFRAFAANADVPFGLVASLLSGGGYFNAAVASPWRAGLVSGTVATLVATISVLAVRRRLRPRAGGGASEEAAPTVTVRRGAVLALVVAGGAGLVVAAIGATALGQSLLAGVAEALPATSLVRDTHRLVGPWVVVLALGLGWAVAAVQRDGGGAGAAAVAVALALVALPDPVVGPRLPGPSQIPSAWSTAAAIVDVDPAPGAVLVVPAAAVQRYPFTDGRPVAVPLRRMVQRPVWTSTLLVVDVGDGTVAVDELGPQPWSALPLSEPSEWVAEEFAAAGVGWLAVLDDTLDLSRSTSFDLVVDAPSIRLLGVPRARPVEGPARRWVLLVDLVVPILLCWWCRPRRGTVVPRAADVRPRS